MRENDNKPRTIAIYARVSTEHEQQMYALNNQIDWYNEILEKHTKNILTVALLELQQRKDHNLCR